MVGTTEGSIRIYELNQFELVNEIKPFKMDSSSNYFLFFFKFLKHEKIEKKNISITNLIQINNALLACNSEGSSYLLSYKNL